MFYIENGTIYLSRGDTGSFTVRTTTEYTFSDDDRAVFTVKDGSGAIVYERNYPLNTELGNGVFLVEFQNPDTDDLATGAYTWDVRYVINPYYDTDTGRIINGDQVLTPKTPQGMTLLAVVGEV